MESELFPANSWGAVYAMCDEGEVVTGGGHEVAAIGHTWVMNQSEPVTIDGVEGWMVALHHFPAPEGETYPDLSVAAIAVCAPGTPAD